MIVNTNHPGYVKDTESGAIINNDVEEYRKFLAAREASKRNNSLQKQVDELQNDLMEIKNILLQLVHRNN